MMGKLVFLVFILLYLVSTHKADENETFKYSVCDDGVANINNDMVSEDTKCGDERIVLQEYYQPAGESYCQDTDNILDGKPQCMSDAILYDAPLPMSGDYRPLPPKYGEYSYLPPQRWLHVLKYGAIVFLYHPCAPVEQVIELKRLARSCLWKHIITPSFDLSREKPFAMVSWGCKYTMSWIDWIPAIDWIRHHSLQTPESIVIEDGQYIYGLIETSNIVSTTNDSVICPLEKDERTTPSTTDTPQLTDVETDIVHDTNDTTNDNDAITVNNNNNDNNNNNINNNCTISDDQFVCQYHNNIVIILHNYPLLYGAIVLMAVIIMTLAIFLFCVCSSKNPLCCLSCGSKKRPLGRYKPCGQFYKGNHLSGHNGDTTFGIVIPELGVPKTFPSEREKLLLESDEDDL